MKLLQQSVALEKSEAHRSIERSKKEIEKIRSDMEHELAKSHDELIAAVKQREDTVRFDCNQDKLNLEKQHNETIAMLNIRASKAVEAAVREGSEEVARQIVEQQRKSQVRDRICSLRSIVFARMHTL